jgi:hypothetical protein
MRLERPLYLAGNAWRCATIASRSVSFHLVISLMSSALVIDTGDVSTEPVGNNVIDRQLAG